MLLQTGEGPRQAPAFVGGGGDPQAGPGAQTPRWAQACMRRGLQLHPQVSSPGLWALSLPAPLPIPVYVRSLPAPSQPHDRSAGLSQCLTQPSALRCKTLPLVTVSQAGEVTGTGLPVRASEGCPQDAEARCAGPADSGPAAGGSPACAPCLSPPAPSLLSACWPRARLPTSATLSALPSPASGPPATPSFGNHGRGLAQCPPR